MKLNIRINLQRITIMLLLLVIFVPCIMAQDVDNVAAKSVPEWIRQNFAIIGLIISESLAFLPSKVGGIVQGVWTIIQAIFKKKYT